MEQLIKRAQQLDELLSRPIQRCVLPASIEFLLSWPGGILFGGSGSVKITYPVLIVLHFVWKPIAPSIAYSILLLAILITPAKSLGKRRVRIRSFHNWHLYFQLISLVVASFTKTCRRTSVSSSTAKSRPRVEIISIGWLRPVGCYHGLFVTLEPGNTSQSTNACCNPHLHVWQMLLLVPLGAWYNSRRFSRWLLRVFHRTFHWSWKCGSIPLFSNCWSWGSCCYCSTYDRYPENRLAGYFAKRDACSETNVLEGKPMS